MADEQGSGEKDKEKEPAEVENPEVLMGEDDKIVSMESEGEGHH